MPDTAATPSVDAARIDALFAAYDSCHAPGVAVGIAIGGRPVYRRAFGLANIELGQTLSPGIRCIVKRTAHVMEIMIAQFESGMANRALGSAVENLHAAHFGIVQGRGIPL